MSDVEISNDALDIIGKGNINSINDPEPAARRCRRFLPRTLREMQASFDWEYTLTVVDISAQAAASTIPGYTYAHKLPTGYLRFSALTSTDVPTNNMLDATFSPIDPNDTVYEAKYLRARARQYPVPMRIADGYVHTNFTPIRLVYHRHRAEYTGLPELFRTALVMQLAAKLCMPLTRDVKLTADVREAANRAVMFAQDEETKDEVHEEPTGSSFEDARR